MFKVLIFFLLVGFNLSSNATDLEKFCREIKADPGQQFGVYLNWYLEFEDICTITEDEVVSFLKTGFDIRKAHITATMVGIEDEKSLRLLKILLDFNFIPSIDFMATTLSRYDPRNDPYSTRPEIFQETVNIFRPYITKEIINEKDTVGMTLLMWGAFLRFPGYIIEEWIRLGAEAYNVTVSDFNGVHVNAITLAIIDKNLEFIKVLEKNYKLEINYQLPYNNYSLLMNLIYTARNEEECFEFAKYLIDRDIDLKIVGHDGKDALFLVKKRGFTRILKMIEDKLSLSLN